MERKIRNANDLFSLLYICKITKNLLSKLDKDKLLFLWKELCSVKRFKQWFKLRYRSRKVNYSDLFTLIS